jgi:hypothetical protein
MPGIKKEDQNRDCPREQPSVGSARGQSLFRLADGINGYLSPIDPEPQFSRKEALRLSHLAGIGTVHFLDHLLS